MELKECLVPQGYNKTSQLGELISQELVVNDGTISLAEVGKKA